MVIVFLACVIAGVTVSVPVLNVLRKANLV
jgi:hypothetical protein